MQTIGLDHKTVTTGKAPSCDKAPLRSQFASASGEFIIFSHLESIQCILNEGKESVTIFCTKTKLMTYLKG